MHQDRLAGPDGRHANQEVVGGEIDHGERGALLEAPFVEERKHPTCGNHHQLALPGELREGDDPVSLPKGRDPLAYLLHRARHLVPDIQPNLVEKPKGAHRHPECLEQAQRSRHRARRLARPGGGGAEVDGGDLRVAEDVGGGAVHQAAPPVQPGDAGRAGPDHLADVLGRQGRPDPRPQRPDQRSWSTAVGEIGRIGGMRVCTGIYGTGFSGIAVLSVIRGPLPKAAVARSRSPA